MAAEESRLTQTSLPLLSALEVPLQTLGINAIDDKNIILTVPHTHTIPERLLGFVKKLKKKPRDIQLSREQRSHADK